MWVIVLLQGRDDAGDGDVEQADADDDAEQPADE
jgi:hypothetical protein